MSQIFQQKRSLAPTVVPPASSLEEGQLAVNIADALLWVGDASGNPVGLGVPVVPTSLYREVINQSGGTIVSGTVVVLDNISNLPTITPADSLAGANMPATGLVLDDIANTETGFVQTIGLVTDITGTDTLVTGDQLYVDTAGGITAVEPMTPNEVQAIGSVLFVESAPVAGDGTIWIDFSGELNSLDGGVFP